ncbi:MULTISPECIES: prepilin-type N-terminal cleavage/methylation domain-containing protein [Mesobacillus]|uniref:type IV pilus modification PilV family protein n=1 Tax=Mesobacillus TaxID=2675231 RepID=UPI00177C1ADA|nr:MULTISPECIES: prepilin-type N-terminal cleavage/methylation domain-containing protein [Mesobacillus]MCM3572071.1 prepilin-type N-terminal cleavage/methylation domain-containing protein [Mesobacillus subterraneus]UYZ20938.1 prepilin-type N-terminal cleavage/methylation domain-containing protein [Mesobacillus jeotgali]
MGKKLDDQSGITLLEVLLSIVLLVIVLTSFAGFFTQSAMFVKKNEDKISTTQTVQQIVNLIEVKLTRDTLSTSTECPSLPCTLNEDHLAELLDRSFGSTHKISVSFNNGEEGLIRVEVSVQDRNNPDSTSRTFTYIRR